MSRNILYSEWREALGQIGAKFASDPAVHTAASWTSPVSRLIVSIDLGNHRDGYLHAQIKISASGTLPTDPLLALTHLADSRSTLQQALSAWAGVSNYRVWIRDCPCDYCSGRGTAHRSSKPCEHCVDGKRNEAQE